MRLPSCRCTSTASPRCTPRATRAGFPSRRSKVTAIEGTSLTARVIAKATRCVYEIFSGRPAAWTLCVSWRRRWSSTSTRTVRKLVAVGTWRLSSMYLTSAAAAPRKGIIPALSPPPLLGSAAIFPPPLVGEGRVGASRPTASATSRRRIEPPGPLPLMVARSMPFAFASSSAPSVTSTGLVFFPPPLTGEGRVGASLPPSLAGEGRVGVFSDAGVAAVAFFAAPSPSVPTAISASAAPTATVFPASARIFTRVPLAGAGTSASTLSVVTSTSPSPSRTWSPGCFSHLAMVPSVTDSPISGRVTCMVDCGTFEFYPLNLGPNMTFKARLRASEDATGSLLCLGLDPEPDLLPPSIERSPAGIAQFVRIIVDAVGDSVSSYKLNLAFYERWGREASWLLDQAMAALPKGRPVIFDAKRGDVGSTSQAYAHAMFEAWGADGVTVHPYLGYDSVAPFLAHRDKEVFIVCRTSNPGAAEFQHLRSDGEALYGHVARAGVRWDHHDNVAFVVGATAPAELRDVRQIAGDRLLLVPGIGAQSGDLAAALKAALRPDGRGAIIPISRGILFASAGADYADAARAAARRYRDAINALRPEPATARG